MTASLHAVSSTSLPAPPTAAGLAKLPHGFFTRQGGVSGGIYGSLNCGAGSGDDPAAVAENRRRVAAAIGADTVASPYQIPSREEIGRASCRERGGQYV